jgi:uncharacterized protein (TIGR02271 family)
MTKTLVAFFDTVAEAEQAAHALALDVGGVRGHVFDANTVTDAYALPIPSEDLASVQVAIRRGGAVFHAEVPDSQFDAAAAVLERSGAVDINEREETWRREGWTANATGGTMGTTAPREVQSDGSIETGATTQGAYEAPTVGPPQAVPTAGDYATPSAGTPQAVPTAGAGVSSQRVTEQTAISYESQSFGTSRGSSTTETGSITATGATDQTGVAGQATADQTATTRQTLGAQEEERIPVIDERLTVGKRETEHGRVRIRSYVVESPVQEQVTLRQEQVEVERRPVDRPVTAGDEVFQDRTIEARETAEEAVVSKEARVTEEVVIRKDVEEHDETIRDTVRETRVEVEDERAGRSATQGTTTDRMDTRPRRGGTRTQRAD